MNQGTVARAFCGVFAAVFLLGLLLSACAPGNNKASKTAVLWPEDAPPAALSEWQLFSLGKKRLQLNSRVTPYDLSSALFTDYAHKLRTVWIPEGKVASEEGGRIAFPVGTIISKTFYYPRNSANSTSGTVPAVMAVTKAAQLATDGGLELTDGLDLRKMQLIETRLLVHQESGWQALPYVWNAEQTEARLQIAGDLKRLQLHVGAQDPEPVEFTYVVPDKNQCAGCHTYDHTSKKLRPIGPTVARLNKDFHYASPAANQLAHWQQAGLLDQALDLKTAAVGADWRDTQGDLDARVRAYLDINCAHCHNPNGAADTSNLLLNIDSKDERLLGFCKPPVAAGKGTGDRRFSIHPGTPEDSIMLYRMNSTNPGAMMPELGRSLAHKEGVALLEEWIAGLPGDCG